MGVAIGAAAALAAGAAAYGSYEASQSNKAATKTNLEMAQAQRDWEKWQASVNRGEYPNFRLPGQLGPDFERGLMTDRQALTYAERDILGTPWAQNARYRNLLAPFNPAIQGSNQTVNDLFDGTLTAQRRMNFAPVSAARVAGAKSQTNSIMDSLMATKNQIAAASRLQGFSGGNTFTNRNLLGATIGARGAAANALSGANLQNAMDMRSIEDFDIEGRLQNINLPYQQAQTALALNDLPFQMVQNNAVRSMQPWEFWKVPGLNQPLTPMPQVGASTGLGQILATAGASAANNYGSYLANRSLAQQYNQRGGIPQYQQNQIYNEMGGQQQFYPNYSQPVYNYPTMQDPYGGAGGGYYDMSGSYA